MIRLIKKVRIPSRSLTIKQWSSPQAIHHIKSSDQMAIIRIVLEVKQQQLRTEYIEQPSENQPHIRQNTRPMSQQNNRFNNSQQQQSENRLSRRAPLRRQVHMLHHEEVNQVNQHQVSQEVRPLLDMIELEEQSQASVPKRSSFAQLVEKYKTINPSKLQVHLSPQKSTITAKQTVFEKILIYGIVWNKEINGLFDYEEKDKNEKSTIVIEEDAKSHINFVSGNNNILPREEDCFLLIFKTKLKKIVYEKSLLRDVRIAALRRHLTQSKQPCVNEQKPSDKEFLCAFKLVMNSMTSQFMIKVYSFDELNNQVNMIGKKSEENETKNIDFIEQINKMKLQKEKNDKGKEPTKAEQVNVITPNQNSDSLQRQKPQTNEPYFIIRTLSRNSPTESIGYKLYPGDLIKMGKIEFKVISIDGVSVEDMNSEYDRRAIEVAQICEDQQKQVECKYCLGGRSQQPDNFFVHLCNCRGHIGYVHYDCLTKWTTTKSSIESAQNVKMYYLEKMKCQVCTKQFPKYFRYNGKLYHILPIDLPEKHLMLVDVSQKHNANTAVITGVQNNTISIGRGRNAHLRVTDITVSRQHATITKIGDDYYIKDCKSKFGTLIRSSEKEIETEIQHKKGFQVNNVIFTVQIIKKQVDREKEAQKSSEKVLTFESIKQEKEGSTEANETMRQKSINQSISTIYKRLSETERNQSSSFDLEKLNPHIHTKQQIKNYIRDQVENNAILEQQDEQTRTTKKDFNNSRQNSRRLEEKLERALQLRIQLRKRMSRQQLEDEEEDFELQNYQNTTNINNNQNEPIQQQKNEKSLRTRSRRIQFEDDEQKESRQN